MVEPLNGFTFNHSDQPDVLTPGVFSSAQLKQNFDSRAEQVRQKVNEVILSYNLNNQNPIVVTAPPYNASGSANIYTGTIASGSRTLTLTTSAHDFTQGQGISIPGAGAAGATLVTTVSAVNGAQVTVSTAASTAVTGVTVGHDDTTAFNAALSAGDLHIWPSGTYVVSSLTIGSNKTIITAGYKTILQQRVGTAAGTRIITIEGDNVVVGAMYYKGNISADTGEFNHALAIRNTTKNQNNIRVGGVIAENIRGDAFIISGNNSYKPQNIHVGYVESINCYRNAVTIAACRDVEIGMVYGKTCGLFGVDIEPDSGSFENITINTIVAQNVGIISKYDALPKNIKIGNCILDRSLGGSMPNYLFSGDSGLVLRNAKHVLIDNLYVTGYDSYAIAVVKSGSDAYTDDITINCFVADNCSLTDTTNNGYVQMASVQRLNINGGEVVLANTKDCFRGANQTDDVYSVLSIRNFNCVTGRLASFCKVIAENVNVTASTSCLSSLKPRSSIRDSTLNGSTVVGFSNYVVLDNCDLAWTTALFSSTGVTNTTRNCRINGTRQPVVTYGTAAPTTGSWVVGDVVNNTNATAGGTVGWICTTAGSPGTWKTFGAITA